MKPSEDSDGFIIFVIAVPTIFMLFVVMILGVLWA